MTSNLFQRALSQVSDKTRERVREWCDKIDEMKRQPHEITKEEFGEIASILFSEMIGKDGWEIVVDEDGMTLTGSKSFSGNINLEIEICWDDLNGISVDKISRSGHKFPPTFAESAKIARYLDTINVQYLDFNQPKD